MSNAKPIKKANSSYKAPKVNKEQLDSGGNYVSPWSEHKLNVKPGAVYGSIPLGDSNIE